MIIIPLLKIAEYYIKNIPKSRGWKQKEAIGLLIHLFS